MRPLYDMHDRRTDASAACKKGSGFARSVCFGDEWLRENLDGYARWAEAHDSLLVVTWDEDSASYRMPRKPSGRIDTVRGSQNRIATILTGVVVKRAPSPRAGTRTTTCCARSQTCAGWRRRGRARARRTSPASGGSRR